MKIPYPSLIAHAMSGLIVAGSVLFAVLGSSRLRGLDTYRILVLALLFAIAIGLHGVSHAILEKEYGYVPFYFLLKSM
jgi:hypothetical protein